MPLAEKALSRVRWVIPALEDHPDLTPDEPLLFEGGFRNPRLRLAHETVVIFPHIRKLERRADVEFNPEIRFQPNRGRDDGEGYWPQNPTSAYSPAPRSVRR